MEHLELVVLGLLVATAALAVLANAVKVPYPIVLVVGGSVIGLVSGGSGVSLDPDIVLLIFLPPLLYGAAFFTSLRDLRRHVRSIALLSIGVVFVTMIAVALVAHHVIGLGWAESFVLGAIVSPTDAVAPAEILRRLGAPRRLITIVEGENLTNDWTALVLYRFAVAAVVTGSFSLAEAGLRFVVNGVGGLLLGLAVGWCIKQVRSRVDDPPTEITISILSGYAAYLPAEELGLSGVIAAVTVGIYMGWHTPVLTTPIMRIQGTSVWEILQFLVNAVLYLLVGLQLPEVLDGIPGRSVAELVGYGALVAAVVIGVRLAWQFSVPYVDHGPGEAGRRLPAAERLVIGWAGMRGSVSLAAALAVPLETDAGAAFPERDLLIFLAYAVIFATLVGQGLTLGPLIDRLRICDDGEVDREGSQASLQMAQAALARIEELRGEDWTRDDTLERVRGLFEYRRRRFDPEHETDRDGTPYEERTDAYRRLMFELFDAQREALIALRNEGVISDEVRRRLERDLDLEETRIQA
ncbi:MAG: Na+/H+ antiporter [Thermoleophilaceae bacterium]|nr:Na+/H+ antiporter [Thermoleophilaceae bacterium]